MYKHIILIVSYIDTTTKNMSSFVEQMRSLSIEPKKEKEPNNIDSKVYKDKQAILNRIQFITDKYYDDILSGIQKSAGKGYNKYFINLNAEDFVIEGIDYEANKLKRRWLSMLLAEKSDLVPEGKPSLNGFRFTVWNNKKNTIVFEW